MSHPSHGPGKRKVVLINPRFQFTFIAWMGGLAVAVVMLMHLAHSWFFFQLKSQARFAGLPANHVFFQFIADRQTELSSITLFSFFAVLAVSVSVGLVLSHKIAGPLHRARVHFERVAKTKENTPLYFREGDFFQEIPDAYNLQFSDPKPENERDVA